MRLSHTTTLNRLYPCMHADTGRVDHRGRAARVFQEIGTQGGMCDLRGGDYCALTRWGSKGHTIRQRRGTRGER